MKNLMNGKTVLAVALAGLVAGCGGGSSSSSSAPTSLNLNAAYAALINGGNSVLYTLSGDCTGYSSQTAFPAYATKNYASPGVSVVAVETIQLDTLSNESKNTVCSEVFNNNDNQVNNELYDPTTKTIVNSGGTSSYWQVYYDQAPLPTSVSAGSSGTLYTWKDFKGASSTSGTPVETGAVTYSVTADTDSTLKVTISDSATNVATGRQAWKVATTYRLNANNTLTTLSVAMNATTDSSLKQALSVNGTATSAVSLNAQSINVASLNAGATDTFSISNWENACSPNATIATGALSSAAGTTTRGVAYQKSNSATFNPSSGFTGGGGCTQFGLPQAESSYFDANYALLQTTTTNSNNVSTSVMSSSVALPDSATINSKGRLYTFDRYSGSETTPFASGNSIYYVGALNPTTLVLFDVETKNYVNTSDRVARQIFARSASQNNQVATAVFGYVSDGYTYFFKPAGAASSGQ